MPTRQGMRLRRLREAQGLTQDHLGKKVGVSYAHISMLESGAKSSPSLALTKKLAKALKVTVGVLVK